MIDKNELLKLLPKLIREDDEIKGAIITALSGVVATKEDIARLIEHSNRRFEEINKRFEENDKRFEEASKERQDIRDSMIILRETAGELIKDVAVVKKDLVEVKADVTIVKKDVIEVKADVAIIKKDVKNGNKEILDSLREQFEQVD